MAQITEQDAPPTVSVPLTRLDDGTLRVSGTRVPIERIVYLYQQGATPEEIHHRFSTVSAADAYAVITYYLPKTALPSTPTSRRGSEKRTNTSTRSERTPRLGSCADVS